MLNKYDTGKKILDSEGKAVIPGLIFAVACNSGSGEKLQR